MRTRTGPSVTLSAIVIRACNICQGTRELGKPCAWCGNREPADVTDLGVIASRPSGALAKLKWDLWQYHAAQRRIRRANKVMLKNSLEGCGE